MAAGANPNAVNSEKRLPIHYALAFGHAEVAGLLWKAGADMTSPDKNGVRYSWNVAIILCVTLNILNRMNRPIDMVENPGAISAEVSALYSLAQLCHVYEVLIKLSCLSGCFAILECIPAIRPTDKALNPSGTEP